MEGQSQPQHKFKVYFGKSIDDVNSKIQADAAQGTMAVQSFGVEYMESRNQFLVSIGYVEGQPGYPIKMTDNVVGPIPEWLSDAPDQLCASMESIVSEFSDVLCHELFVDNDEVVHFVLLTKL